MADLTIRFGKAFDAARKKIHGPAAKLLLLKINGGDSRFTELTRLEEGWHPYFSQFAGVTFFQVAKQDTDFNSKVMESSHLVVVDSSNPALNEQLFQVRHETTIPAGVEPFWKIACEQINRRYVPA